MNQRKLTTLILLGLLTAGPALAGDPPAATPTADAPLPRGMASGYPPAGGKGPGSRQSYRSGTPGTGQGAPQYQGGRSAPGAGIPNAPATPPAAATPDAGTAPGQSPRDMQYGTAPDWRAYRYRRAPYRGYGYGYGYPGYRGLGGGSYRHHRQFGAPPLYPVQPPPAAIVPGDND